MRPAGSAPRATPPTAPPPPSRPTDLRRYWHLRGAEAAATPGAAWQHTFRSPCRYWTPAASDGIPTGEVIRVDALPDPDQGAAPPPFPGFLDFRGQGRGLGGSTPEETAALEASGGLDHNLVAFRATDVRAYGLWAGGGGTMRLAAELSDPRGEGRDPEASGRWLKIFTNQPGLHVYTSGGMGGGDGDEGGPAGRRGVRYARFGAVALEAQVWPDAVTLRRQGPRGLDKWPDPVLKPGEERSFAVSFEFGAG